MLASPTKIELVGSTLAIVWPDGKEDYLEASHLRKHSPSAEQKGEQDIFGNISGGSESGNYTDVGIKGFQYVGNYAIRIQFSDGHSTGIYSWEYLCEIAEGSN
tara:strand:+ start:277 stop:585 length:309 start_codon:yes stop_codon:yes gene_type:complete